MLTLLSTPAVIIGTIVVPGVYWIERVSWDVPGRAGDAATSHGAIYTIRRHAVNDLSCMLLWGRSLPASDYAMHHVLGIVLTRQKVNRSTGGTSSSRPRRRLLHFEIFRQEYVSYDSQEMCSRSAAAKQDKRTHGITLAGREYDSSARRDWELPTER